MQASAISARIAVVIAAAVAVAFIAAGCARTTVDQPLQTNYLAADAESGELDFWFGLPGRSAVTNDEALHALFLLADAKDEATSYEDRLDLAKDRGWIGVKFDEPADMAARRGIISLALYNIMDIDGGVINEIFGPTPRYAHRELVARGLMLTSSEWQVISGREFMALITRARDRANLIAAAERGKGG